jgi:hypothetical protein
MEDLSKPESWRVIWSLEHQAWWKPQERGYTRDLAAAGLYPLHTAERICRTANIGMMINEVHFAAPDNWARRQGVQS